MASDNQITIVGNLTRDPELRMTRNDNALVNLGVAVNRRVMNNGQWEDKLDGFFNVIVWNEQAHNIANSLNKGDRVIAVGRMVQNNYKDAQGNERQSFELHADELAPSLKWATAQVQRSRGGSNYNSGGGNYNNAGGNYNAGGGNYNNAGGNYNAGGGNYNSGADYNNSGNPNAGNENNEFPGADIQPYSDGGSSTDEDLKRF